MFVNLYLRRNGLQDISSSFRHGMHHVEEFSLDPETVIPSLPDFQSCQVYLDTFFTRILDNPTWYGFKDNKCYSCIGCYNVTGCFWSNNYHPVWQVHERLASDMVANLTSIGWPVLEFE